MFRPRVIPILLLKETGLVKSIRFKNYRYIGDAINAVRIFNDLRVDEIVILDIMASKENRTISVEFIRKVGDEASMPFSVGGGVRSLMDIKEIINAGAEKVIINTYAAENPDFIREASVVFGSSSIVVSIDVKRNFFGKQQVYKLGGKTSVGQDPISFAQLMEKNGAGEIIINSIDNDGLMTGYDLNLIATVSKSVGIPIIAAGGAGTFNDFRLAVHSANASAVAAGSMFVYHGPRNAVLVNYPEEHTKKEIFN
jgi:imidazole glycerol-phosphate synthase subunit HisF